VTELLKMARKWSDSAKPVEPEVEKQLPGSDNGV
jgi:hypothetical protein